jgi:hypothetical protein
MKGKGRGKRSSDQFSPELNGPVLADKVNKIKIKKKESREPTANMTNERPNERRTPIKKMQSTT